MDSNTVCFLMAVVMAGQLALTVLLTVYVLNRSKDADYRQARVLDRAMGLDEAPAVMPVPKAEPPMTNGKGVATIDELAIPAVSGGVR